MDNGSKVSPYRDVSFVVQTIRDSKGGEKLSHEALTIIAVLALDELTPYHEFVAIDILTRAHDYLWAQKSIPLPIRLEMCNLLFKLASNLWLTEMEKEK